MCKAGPGEEGRERQGPDSAPSQVSGLGGPYLEVGRRGPVPMRLSAPLTGGVWLETLP